MLLLQEVQVCFRLLSLVAFVRTETKTAAFFSDEQHFILHFHGFQLFQVGMAKVYVIFDAQWFYLLKPAVFMALKNLSGIIQHAQPKRTVCPMAVGVQSVMHVPYGER